MKESIYIQATKRAWRFVWDNKTIWIFGIFAAFLGQFGMVEFLGKVGVSAGNAGRYFDRIGSMSFEMGGFTMSIVNSLQNRLLALSLLLLLASLVVVFVYAAVICQGAIIHSSAQSIAGKKHIDILKAWHVSHKSFWSLFIINLFKKILIMFLSVMVSITAYGALTVPTLGNSLFFLFVFIFTSALGIILSFLVVYTAAYVVVEKYTLMNAIHGAWDLFAEHWLSSIEVGLIILVFNLFLGVLILLGFMLILLPAILLWFLVIVVGSSQSMLYTGLIAGLIVFVMYLMTMGAMFTVFVSYMWTYVFMKMHKVGVKSRLVNYLSYSKKGSR